MENRENLEQNEFYVYVYLDPRKPGLYKYMNTEISGTYNSETIPEFCFEYLPFYIGKGHGDRLRSHLHQNKTSVRKENIFKSNKIKSIMEETNSEPIIIKYKEGLSEVEAYDLETTMILSIGRKYTNPSGPLTNIADGGANPPKWNKGKTGVYSPELIKQISDKLKGRKFSEETLQRMNEAAKRRQEKYTHEDYKRWNLKKLKKYKFEKDGKIIIIENLKQYCKDNNLSHTVMVKIFNRGVYRISKTINGIIEIHECESYKGYIQIKNEEQYDS
jgi:hypothetical protein